MYLVWEELSQNEENYISILEQKFRRGSKGSMLKAPYKDRLSKIKIILQTTTEKPLHYKNPKESLFIRREWQKSKSQWSWGKRKTDEDEDRKETKRDVTEGDHKMSGETDKEGEESDARSRKKPEGKLSIGHITYILGQKLFVKYGDTRKTTEILIKRLPFQKLVRETAQEITSNLTFQASVLSALQEAAERYIVDLMEDSNLSAMHPTYVIIMP